MKASLFLDKLSVTAVSGKRQISSVVIFDRDIYASQPKSGLLQIFCGHLEMFVGGEPARNASTHSEQKLSLSPTSKRHQQDGQQKSFERKRECWSSFIWANDDRDLGVFDTLSDSIQYWILPKNDSFNIRFNISLPKIRFKISIQNKLCWFN